MDKKRNGTAVWEVGINNQLSAVSVQLSAKTQRSSHPASKYNAAELSSAI